MLYVCWWLLCACMKERACVCVRWSAFLRDERGRSSRRLRRDQMLAPPGVYVFVCVACTLVRGRVCVRMSMQNDSWQPPSVTVTRTHRHTNSSDKYAYKAKGKGCSQHSHARLRVDASATVQAERAEFIIPDTWRATAARTQGCCVTIR